MKYIIADSDEESSNKLKILLDSLKYLEYCGCFKTGKAVLRSIKTDQPDVMFIKIGSALNAYKLINDTREYNSFLKIVVISDKQEYAVEAYEMGADGFLLEPFEKRKLKSLIYKI